MLGALLRRSSSPYLIVVLLLTGLLAAALNELEQGTTSAVGSAQGEPTALAQSFPTESDCEEYRASGVIAGVSETTVDSVSEFAQNCLLLTPVSEPADMGGLGGVGIDEAAGVICARAEQGPANGTACTRTDADRPMIMALTGQHLENSTHIIVVDPQRRLGALRIFSDEGEMVANQVQEQGLWMQTVLPSLPTEIVVLDTEGQELSVIRPVEDQTSVRSEIERTMGEPPEQE